MAAAGVDQLLARCRESDPDRYITLLWLPAELRADVAAVYAAAAEIEAVPLRVKEPVAGEIRLQWWAEVVDGRREHSGHPVASALLDCIRRRRLPRRAFADLAQAHVFDLYHDPMPDMTTLEAWCGETSSTVFQMTALIAGAEPGRTLADACGHAGCASAIAKLARIAGFHRTQSRCFIPADLLAAAGLDPGRFLAEPWSPAHAAAVDAFAAAGSDHLAKAAAALSLLPPGVRPVFLPLATVRADLALAVRQGARLFEAAPELSLLRRHWLVGRAALTGRIG